MDQNVRNIIIVAGVVIASLVVLGFIGTLLSAILPLAIVAVVAFVLGRMSTQMDLMKVTGDFVTQHLLGNLLKGNRSTRQTTAQKAPPVTPDVVLSEEKSAAKPTAKPAAAPQEAAVEQRLADPVDADPVDSVDFQIKTAEQLQEEGRRLEEEVAQRNAGYDAQAAIEERKRRLLGNSD